MSLGLNELTVAVSTGVFGKCLFNRFLEMYCANSAMSQWRSQCWLKWRLIYISSISSIIIPEIINLKKISVGQKFRKQKIFPTRGQQWALRDPYGWVNTYDHRGNVISSMYYFQCNFIIPQLFLHPHNAFPRNYMDLSTDIKPKAQSARVLNPFARVPCVY